MAPTPSDTDALDRHAADWLADVKRRVERYLNEVLPRTEGPAARLSEAMRYSVLAGGKRLRPALALASAEGAGGGAERALPFAAALEMVHTYSLIHDDLPAMDDDDLRRGRPTSHKVFGEAVAILAGDALHSLAFEVLLAGTPDADAARGAALELARAAGPEGMVGGQVEDLSALGREPDAQRLLHLQEGKTAALIAAACRGGAIVGGAPPEHVEAVGRFGRLVGLAFQMVDDVLDATGTAEALGKRPGRDREERRMTWVALDGVGGARARAESTVERALAALGDVPGRELLTGLALYVTRRDR